MSGTLFNGLPLSVSDKDGKTIMSGLRVADPKVVVKVVNEYLEILNRCAVCLHPRSEHFDFEQPRFCCDGCGGFQLPLTHDEQLFQINALTAKLAVANQMIQCGANGLLYAEPVLSMMWGIRERFDSEIVHHLRDALAQVRRSQNDLRKLAKIQEVE
jgi:hypothetical protein